MITMMTRPRGDAVRHFLESVDIGPRIDHSMHHLSRRRVDPDTDHDLIGQEPRRLRRHHRNNR